MDYISHYNSPLGRITMGSDGEALIGLWFDDQKHFGANLGMEQRQQNDLPIFELTRKWLDIYFSGKAPQFTPPLQMRASDFRKQVWKQLLNIPFGQTTTYGEIAKSLGGSSAIAVGGAIAHNAISLIIPCHRVIASDGNLRGYAGGLDRKRWLLEMEQKGETPFRQNHQK